MAQAPNKLFSRAEIRSILSELSSARAMMLVEHRDAYRHDDSHVEATCKICHIWQGHVEGLLEAIRHFGGRS
jgi:hypothetical protein